MTTLLSLPNELIIHIYTHAPTLQAAACLSAVNRRLRSVWLENTNQIAEPILRRQIPAYDEAVDVAILEAEIYDSPHSPAKNDYPLHLYVNRLLNNASLASSAVTAWVADARDEPYPEESQAHSSYYLMRKLRFEYDHPHAELRQEIFLLLETSSYKVLDLHDTFTGFLLGPNCSDEERRRQGTHKDQGEWTESDEMEYEMGGTVNVERWEYARGVLEVAREGKRDGVDMLKDFFIDRTPRQNWQHRAEYPINFNAFSSGNT
jgi:hypothetical protein